MSYITLISDSELHCAFMDSESGFWRSKFSHARDFYWTLRFKVIFFRSLPHKQTNSTNTDTHTHTLTQTHRQLYLLMGNCCQVDETGLMASFQTEQYVFQIREKVCRGNHMIFREPVLIKTWTLLRRWQLTDTSMSCDLFAAVKQDTKKREISNVAHSSNLWKLILRVSDNIEGTVSSLDNINSRYIQAYIDRGPV